MAVIGKNRIMIYGCSRASRVRGARSKSRGRGSRAARAAGDRVPVSARCAQDFRTSLLVIFEIGLDLRCRQA